MRDRVGNHPERSVAAEHGIKGGTHQRNTCDGGECQDLRIGAPDVEAAVCFVNPDVDLAGILQENRVGREFAQHLCQIVEAAAIGTDNHHTDTIQQDLHDQRVGGDAGGCTGCPAEDGALNRGIGGCGLFLGLCFCGGVLCVRAGGLPVGTSTSSSSSAFSSTKVLLHATRGLVN